MTKLLDIEFDFEVVNIVEDSRKVIPGSIFVCIKGLHADGHDYVDKAVENGASFIFSERELNVEVPYKVVKDTQIIYSNLNAAFYGKPQNKMTFVGVTGTDGKTSTSTLLKDMLSTVKKVAYLGTNGLEFEGESEYLGYTTPPADILYKKLAEVASKQAEIVCMEASSMALDQKRCEDLRFDVAIFTNLSHEHLDVHKTMEHYFESKAILFDKVTDKGNRIINIDDEYGKTLYSMARSIAIPKL
jgi:UDP-N-acetylmuramoyl-L-alanyl-D-glutamate--2,6-diaminopimelate ligase